MPRSFDEQDFERMYQEKEKLDDLCGVREYKIDQNSMAVGIIGKYNPSIAPRTNAVRIQNIDQDTFNLIKKTSYYTSVKIDGMSITICMGTKFGDIRVFSHNSELDTTIGIGKIVKKLADKQGLTSIVYMYDLVLQCELAGPKIQKNKLGLKEKRLFVFSVWNPYERFYFDALFFNKKLLNSCVPFIGEDYGSHFLYVFETSLDLIEWVNNAKGITVKGKVDEGIVIHVTGKGMLSEDEYMLLKEVLGDTMQVKVVSAKYLAKM